MISLELWSERIDARIYVQSHLQASEQASSKQTVAAVVISSCEGDSRARERVCEI